MEHDYNEYQILEILKEYRQKKRISTAQKNKIEEHKEKKEAKSNEDEMAK